MLTNSGVEERVDGLRGITKNSKRSLKKALVCGEEKVLPRMFHLRVRGGEKQLDFSSQEGVTFRFFYSHKSHEGVKKGVKKYRATRS